MARAPRMGHLSARQPAAIIVARAGILPGTLFTGAYNPGSTAVESAADPAGRFRFGLPARSGKPVPLAEAALAVVLPPPPPPKTLGRLSAPVSAAASPAKRPDGWPAR